MKANDIPHGTRISIIGHPAIGGFPAVPSELGTIMKPRKANLPKPTPDYFLIRFDSDGGRLYIHRSRFEILCGEQQ